jgi:hypothetical protein
MRDGRRERGADPSQLNECGAADRPKAHPACLQLHDGHHSDNQCECRSTPHPTGADHGHHRAGDGDPDPRPPAQLMVAIDDGRADRQRSPVLTHM